MRTGMQDDTFLTKEEKKELKREKAEKRNQVIAYVFAVLLFGGYALWSLGFGIYGLFMAEHLELSELGSDVSIYAFYEGDLGAISDLSDGDRVQFGCDLEHTISGLPYAHEYFYIIMMDDLHKAVPVRAGKHWGEQLGGSAGVSSIPIKGQIRKMGSYEVEKFLKNIVENNSNFFAGYQVETDYYIDLTGTKMNILHIVVGISQNLCVGTVNRLVGVIFRQEPNLAILITDAFYSSLVL